MPETLSDFILLLTAAKEKYGDLKVRFVRNSDYANFPGDYEQFSDVVINGVVQSLIKCNSRHENQEQFFVFVAD